MGPSCTGGDSHHGKIRANVQVYPRPRRNLPRSPSLSFYHVHSLSIITDVASWRVRETGTYGTFGTRGTRGRCAHKCLKLVPRKHGEGRCFLGPFLRFIFFFFLPLPPRPCPTRHARRVAYSPTRYAFSLTRTIVVWLFSSFSDGIRVSDAGHLLTSPSIVIPHR